MTITIREFVLQIKVCENNKQGENPRSTPGNNFSNTTEQQKLALARDLLHLLEDRAAR